MDPSATPWRVLEDAPGPKASEPAPAPGGIGAVPRSAVLTAGLAAILAIAAIVVALGAGTSGDVVVDGAAPLGPVTSGSGPVAGGLPAAGDVSVLIVEIVGAVDHPGVYRVATDARIGDLVAAAGGYGPRVDTDRATRQLNLAAPLHDGDQIRVPSRDDPPDTGTLPASGPGTAGDPSTTGPIDLNHATEAELDTLPGIGPVTAAKILASRNAQSFIAVDDLRTRGLVGQKTFDGLKDLVAVR